MSHWILGAIEEKKDEKICIYTLVTSYVRPAQPSTPLFLNHRAATRYRALASIIPGRENLSF
jgi:hypothetical protein